jgi:SMODS and SLOG-associating 2TM effector domain
LTLGLRSKERDEELSTSIYYSILKQERRTRRLYILYDIVTYACMIAQLFIASVLIIIGARGGNDHIVISILGAVTGILTGILSLIKGQGFPNRLIHYGDSMRRLREDIEFIERELRADRRIVTYGEVVALRNTYESVREDESKNRPDVWSTELNPNVGKGRVGTPVAKSTPSRSPDSMV